MIKTSAGLHPSPEAAIKAAWNDGPKMDWLGLENVLRCLLKECPEAERTAVLYKIDEAVAAFTKRGNELPEAP